MLPLDNLKLRDIEAGFMSRRCMFALFNIENRYLIFTLGLSTCACITSNIGVPLWQFHEIKILHFQPHCIAILILSLDVCNFH